VDHAPEHLDVEPFLFKKAFLETNPLVKAHAGGMDLYLGRRF
jgi:hypothetical protein